MGELSITDKLWHMRWKSQLTESCYTFLQICSEESSAALGTYTSVSTHLAQLSGPIPVDQDRKLEITVILK